jgi:DNA-binding MarR family transcriptional regulator
MIPPVPRFPGVELALLLLDGFHSMTDDVHAELANRGHPGVRASHEFTLRAIDEGADTASELGRRLSVTKQAAAQAIAVLEQFGYVDREADPSDARLKRLRVTPRGHEMMALGAMLFDQVRDRWAAQIGVGELDVLQAHLARLTERRSLTADDLL